MGGTQELSCLNSKKEFSSFGPQFIYQLNERTEINCVLSPLLLSVPSAFIHLTSAVVALSLPRGVTFSLDKGEEETGKNCTKRIGEDTVREKKKTNGF